MSTNTKTGWLLTSALATAVALGGCGDEVQPAPPQAGAGTPVATKNPRRGRRAAVQKGELQFYPKVESLVSDPEEAANIRHRFTTRDFEPDGTGDINRDPFRSYVIRPQGLGRQATSQLGGEPTAVCNSKSLTAPTYSLRDLKLVGIVLRGTRSYALFRDTASYGHIVRKGDCLGQEKARVVAIRAGFVSLEIQSDPALGQEPQERAIQLYPDEIAVDTEAQ